MALDTATLQAQLAECRAESDRYKVHVAGLEQRRDELLKEVDALEAEVARLESEGLKPVVDRLRAQIIAIKKLVTAMALAIEELETTIENR